MTNIEDIMINSALEAVSCMNAVFSALDNIIDQHNVYKVHSAFFLDSNFRALFSDVSLWF